MLPISTQASIFGGVNVEPIASALKQQHIDGLIFMPMDNNTNFAIVTAAKQTGADVTVSISATGYGQALLDQPTALAAPPQGSFFDNPRQPTGTPNAPTTNGHFANALKQYAGYTSILRDSTTQSGGCRPQSNGLRVPGCRAPDRTRPEHPSSSTCIA